MARMYATVLPTDKAQYLEDSFGQGVIRHDTPVTDNSERVSLSEAAYDYLTSIPSDSDGHIDSDGVLWIGGTEYPLEVLHNA